MCLANRIIVVGEGRVLEEGMHEELLARGGIYADLFTLQADATLPPPGSVRLTLSRLRSAESSGQRHQQWA